MTQHTDYHNISQHLMTQICVKSQMGTNQVSITGIMNSHHLQTKGSQKEKKKHPGNMELKKKPRKNFMSLRAALLLPLCHVDCGSHCDGLNIRSWRNFIVWGISNLFL